ncbi:UNVERIFIED_CONTAM: hypothetical protein FKN15_025078 [Acipenser sinensis]
MQFHQQIAANSQVPGCHMSHWCASCAGPGDVPCDFCTGRKFKAVNSCLTCLTSYCETHVKPHLEVAAFKRHTLIEAAGNLEQKICDEHQKVLEVFCRTDQTCICVLCIDKEHKSHDTVSAEAGRQEKLGETQTQLELRIQERLRELEELKQAVESLKNLSQHCNVPYELGRDEDKHAVSRPPLFTLRADGLANQNYLVGGNAVPPAIRCQLAGARPPQGSPVHGETRITLPT